MATTSGSRTVHVVDDDPDVLRSLEQVLLAAGFHPVLYETPFALLDAVDRLADGCVLVDVRMPRMDGLQLQERLNELGSRLPVIFITGQGNIPMAVRAMKCGAVDFIEKPFDDNRLLSSITSALALVSRRSRYQAAIEAAHRVATLSRRERQVLDGLMTGRTNKAMARDLGLSVRTVEVHRARMLERLGTHSLAEAIRLAVTATLDPRDAVAARRKPRPK
jgi:two-component system response regulator FixJ